MAEIIEENRQEMAGWHYGAKALNVQQHFYGVLCDAILEFTYSLAC